MTIFDSKIYEINTSIKSIFHSSYEITNWKYQKSHEYRSDFTMSRIKGKKKVTFADDRGQDLTEVFIIDKSVFPDLKHLSIYDKSNNHNTKNLLEDVKSEPCDWVTSFIQPASMYSRFKLDLSQLKVKLATAVINKTLSSNNTYEYQMTGIIKLVNLCYKKRVFIRLSSDSLWTSFSDFEAKYNSSSSDFLPQSNSACDIDEFEFQILLPKCEDNKVTYLEFVVGLETPESGNYWDNNAGKNYRIDYCQISPDQFSNGLSTRNPYTLDYKPNMQPFHSMYTGYRAWDHFSEELNFY